MANLKTVVVELTVGLLVAGLLFPIAVAGIDNIDREENSTLDRIIDNVPVIYWVVIILLLLTYLYVGDRRGRGN